LKTLAKDKAPQTVSQLVLWNVSAGLDWPTIARLSQGWANAHELTLARQVVERLDAAPGSPPKNHPGVPYSEVKSEGEKGSALAAELRKLLGRFTVLGLKATEGVPEQPDGPAIGCRLVVEDTKVNVSVAASDAQGTSWVSAGTFALKRGGDAAK